MPPTVLALDVGTQSSRAFLFTERGEVISRAQRKHMPLISPQPGTAEVDVNDIWSCLLSSMKECLDGHKPPVAVGLANQRRVFIPVNNEASPIGLGLSWLDTRLASSYPGMGWIGGAAFRLTGKSRLPGALVSYSQANLLHETRPDDYAAADRFLTLSGWLTRKLTGEDADACGGFVGAWPYNVNREDWFRISWIHKMCGKPLEMLPRLVPTGGVLGRFLPGLCEKLGLCPDTPLISVGGDKQAEVLGAGVTASSEGLAEVSLGTGASISVVGRRGVSSRDFHWITVNAAEPGAWCHEYILQRGFWMWTWYLRHLGAADLAAAEAAGIAPEECLGKKIAGIPPGCDGLVAIPRWGPLAEAPETAGALVGFSEMHTRHHIARALVEGIVFDLLRGKDRLERRFGKIDRLRVGGGGSKSPEVLKILADVFGLPVEAPADPELTARGIAMAVLVSRGIIPDSKTAAHRLARVSGTVDPDPKLGELYQKIYRRRFLPAFKGMRALRWWRPI